MKRLIAVLVITAAMVLGAAASAIATVDDLGKLVVSAASVDDLGKLVVSS